MSPLGSSILDRPSAVPGSRDGLRNRSWRSHFRHTTIKGEIERRLGYKSPQAMPLRGNKLLLLYSH